MLPHSISMSQNGTIQGGLSSITMSFFKKNTKFGIEGRMLGWIQDFLDGRKIRVRVADEHSAYVGYENGSP